MFFVIAFAPYAASYAVRIISIMLDVFLITMGDGFSSISRLSTHPFKSKFNLFVSINLCNASHPLSFVIAFAGFLSSFIQRISMISLRL